MVGVAAAAVTVNVAFIVAVAPFEPVMVMARSWLPAVKFALGRTVNVFV